MTSFDPYCIDDPLAAPHIAPAIGERIDVPSRGGSMPEAFVGAQVQDITPAHPAHPIELGAPVSILAPARGSTVYVIESAFLAGWMTTPTPWWPNPLDNREPREHQPYAVP